MAEALGNVLKKMKRITNSIDNESEEEESNVDNDSI